VGYIDRRNEATHVREKGEWEQDTRTGREARGAERLSRCSRIGNAGPSPLARAERAREREREREGEGGGREGEQVFHRGLCA